MTLEIACFDIEGALLAANNGADRLELCSNYGEGGVTPSLGYLTTARKLISIPLFVIIRPRGGNFVYTDAEIEVMKHDILTCKKLGFDGVVLGFLTKDNLIDKHITSSLVDLAYPMDVTFHRAFDSCADQVEALKQVINCGCQRILTSGNAANAKDGAISLAKLVSLAGNEIAIMPGGGVTQSNLEQIKNETGATNFHSSARFPSGTINDQGIVMLDPNAVRSMKTILQH